MLDRRETREIEPRGGFDVARSMHCRDSRRSALDMETDQEGKEIVEDSRKWY